MEQRSRSGTFELSVQKTGPNREMESKTLLQSAPSLLGGERVKQWSHSLFPFLTWIGRYNVQWFAGDMVAGITIGAVVVPQGMAYSILAGLEPQFGLYSSFMGVLIYWFFATSKDITIGPVAVMSVLVGQITERARLSHPDVPAHVIASALAFVAGGIIVLTGLVRLGWIVDLIPLVSITAFMTGSAINIAAGQLPALLGITGFNTRESTYNVIINTIRGLSRTKIDAVLGISALAILYLVRFGCTYAGQRHSSKAKTLFFVSTLRTVFVILLYTIISFFVNRNRRSNPLFAILKTVPGGFQNIAVPSINADILSVFVADLPATVLVLLLEHIAIAKSFGRVNNYTIDPSQEMVAIGITNILGSFLGAYPATGSFSRTAIKSKAGVRTPFAGVVTAMVVLVAIYVLPAVFFYIPNAALSAVIIHAVLDLIATSSTIRQFWHISPLEVPIFFVGVLITIYSSIEDGIYATVAASFCLLLGRLLYARLQYQSVTIDETQPLLSTPHPFKIQIEHDEDLLKPTTLHAQGIILFQPSTSLTYLTVNTTLDVLTSLITTTFRRTNLSHYANASERPWNDSNPLNGKGRSAPYHERPALRAIILDLKNVRMMDLTAAMRLLDVKTQMDMFASPSVCSWYFANGATQVEQALLATGFGMPTSTKNVLPAEIITGQNLVAQNASGTAETTKAAVEDAAKDVESVTHLPPLPQRTQVTNIDESRRSDSTSRSASRGSQKQEETETEDDLVPGTKLLTERATMKKEEEMQPFHFYDTLMSAVQSAVRDVEARAREEAEVETDGIFFEEV